LKSVSDRISIRQAVIIFVLMIGAPSLRVIPNYISRLAGRAGWVSPFFALLFSILLVFVLASLFKTKNGSIYNIFEDVYGRIISKMLALFYIIWCIFMAAFYLRMYGERFIETIVFDANITSIIILMAAFVLFIVNQKIDVLGRMAEILILFFAGIVVIVFFIIVSNIKIENLWPVTHYDLVPSLKGSTALLSLSVYLTTIMFLGDKISNKDKLIKTGIKGMILLHTLAIIIVLSTIGLIGYRLNGQLLFPYFATLKNIDILNTFEHVESLVISIWLGADVAIISVFVMAVMNLIKQSYTRIYNKRISLWIMIIAVLISLTFVDNVYDAEKIARLYIGNISLVLFGGIPILTWIVGKIRKVI